MSGEQQPCPVLAAHRRLVDIHELWHQLAEAYMDPAAFRRLLNTIVPELRNVSWLIQKQKNQLDGYAEWYPQWQSGVAEDPVMLWIVKTRNRVVKEGDLELLSTLKLRYQSTRHKILNQEFSDAPARLSTHQILAGLLQKDRLPKDGLLTVRRTWLDSGLPNFELLGALAHAWSTCARLVSVAHGARELNKTAQCLDSADWTRTCVLSSVAPEDTACLHDASNFYETALDLSKGTLQRTRTLTVVSDEASWAEVRERYGEIETSGPGDAIERVPLLLAMGRRLLEIDDDLLTTVHYYKGDSLVDMTAVTFDDQISVIRGMAQVAERVRELQADSVALSSEIWTAVLDKSRNEVFASDRDDRSEALLIQAARSDGTARLVMLPFFSDSSGVRKFGEPVAATDLHNFEPLRQEWGLRRWWLLSPHIALADCSSPT